RCGAGGGVRPMVHQKKLVESLLETKLLDFKQYVINGRGNARDGAWHAESVANRAARIFQPSFDPCANNKDRAVFRAFGIGLDLLQSERGYLLVERAAHPLVRTEHNEPPASARRSLHRNLAGPLL